MGWWGTGLKNGLVHGWELDLCVEVLFWDLYQALVEMGLKQAWVLVLGVEGFFLGFGLDLQDSFFFKDLFLGFCL